MDLETCLRRANWRTLSAIAHTHRLRLEPRPTKERLVEALAGTLNKRVPTETFTANLSPAARALLASLAEAGGSLPLAAVTAAYGPLRPLSGVGEGDPRRLARQPQSVIETLVFWGALFIIPAADPPGHLAILPHEWLPIFRPPVVAPSSTLEAVTAQPPLDLSLALAVYLAGLQSEPARLIHTHRLNAAAVRRLAALLRIPLRRYMREQQTPLLTFLRYVGDRLGLLLIHHGALAPSPLAAAWLEQPAAARLDSIWRVLLADTPDNHAGWRRHHLPGSSLRRPPLFAQRLLNRLTALTSDTSPWLSLDDLVPVDDNALLVTDLLPWWETERRPDLARQVARALLTGPLGWLDTVQVTQPPRPACGLTPTGRWLLGQGRPPIDIPALPLSLDTTPRPHIDAPFILRLPSAPRLPALLALADWADPVPAVPLEPTPVHFEITPASVSRAITRGGSVDDLLRLLTQQAQPDSAALVDLAATAHRWATPAQTFSVRTLTVLTAPTAAHLDAILDRRALRRRLGRRLSPTEIELDPAHLHALLSALRRQGHSVALSAAPNDIAPGALPSSHAQSSTPLSPTDLTWLLTALHGYTHLAHRLHLPPPPAAVADRLAEAVPGALGETSRRAADLAAHRLDRVLANLDPALAPLPVETALSALHAAIERRANLTMTYWTPTRPLPIARQVTPRRIEWRGDTPYLVAYCHLQDAERTFRLDRIIQLDSPTQS